MNLNERVVLLSAFRYALGRMSYVVSVVTEELIKNWDNLDSGEKEQIKSEIQEAIKNNNAGHRCDINNWEEVLDLK